MSSISLYYSNSLSGTTESIAEIARRMSQGSRATVDITLDDHSEDKVYSTFDDIRGHVDITAARDVRFDFVMITLEGSTMTSVENLSPSVLRSRITAVHKFLTLAMPVRESEYPTPRVAEAGRTYTFKFNFVIPEHLVLQSCSHTCSAPHIHQAHLAVPPSMGDRELSGLEDLTPETAKITYAVKVKIVKHGERDGQEAVLMEGSKKLRVIPAVAEAAPLSLGEGCDEDYISSKTKILKKGVFSSKLGHITVSAAQPNAFVLPAPSLKNTAPPSAVVWVKLRFDPHDAASNPPRLGGLNVKIRSSTFYAALPATAIPSHYSMVTQLDSTRGVYDCSVSLSSRCIESVVWERHKTRQEAEPQGSFSLSSSLDWPKTAMVPELNSGRPFYTASVVVPISLPTNKSWLPTFHSCTVSRVYAINLSLSVHIAGAGVPARSIDLQLPIQIAANGNQEHRPELTAAEAAAELADMDAFL